MKTKPIINGINKPKPPIIFRKKGEPMQYIIPSMQCRCGSAIKKR